MGKRGPPPADPKALELRGSWRAKPRKKAARKKAAKKVGPASIKWNRFAITDTELKRAIKLIPGYDPYRGAEGFKFDLELARNALRFFHEQLSHVKGEKARQPFILEPWQQAIIANLFGWVHKTTELRRYKQAFIFVPRKNGKTILAAGIVLYVLFEDEEPCAEIYGAASEYKQASLVFEQARGMIWQNEDLRERCKVYNGQVKSVQLESDYSTYRVISSGSLSSHGFNTHLYVVDETHTQPDSDLVDALETSIGARTQPLGIHITTSDYDRPSICNEKHEYATKVRDGVLNDAEFLPVIYEASLDDDWTDPKVWAAANPNLGVSLSVDYIAAACQKAQDVPRFENTFKRLHLDIRTEQDVRFLQLEKWDACDGELNPEDLEGETCFAGLDLATTIDIAAFVLFFPDLRAVVPYFWVPKESAIQREKRDRVTYLSWAKQGLIRLTEGDVIDYDVIRRDINEISETHHIKEIAIDRWNSTQLQTQLAGDGFDIIQFGQGFASMSAPTKELEKMVVAGDLVHGANPVMRWMISNLAVETDAAGNLKPSKKKSTEKIDGPVALIMAIGQSLIGDTEGSIYENQGVDWL